MSISTSVLSDLLESLPHLRPQLYFKTSLTALSHAMEDQVLAANLDRPLIIASFQKERFYRQEAHRYQRLAEKSNQIYVLAAPETEFSNSSEYYEKIAFEPDDALTQEWHLLVVADNYTTCLICRESPDSLDKNQHLPEMIPSFDMDTARRFEGIWTSEKGVCLKAAQLLLDRIQVYRPDLADKIDEVLNRLEIRNLTNKLKVNVIDEHSYGIDIDPFVQRLVAYLQASQYKLHKAYRSIAVQARKDRLINSISTAIRRSLDPAQATDTKAIIEHEFLNSDVASVLGQNWELELNPLFQQALRQLEGISVADTLADDQINKSPVLSSIVRQFGVRSWLIEPVLYQGRILGIVELHDCHFPPHEWQPGELDLVRAIATQIGAALIQAESFANLEELNQQLEALDRTRSNLIAITGHELRTPLSTIQVCLESLATEPDMPWELQQIMLNTALSDSERMRKLVQDFLTLSNLESGQVEWHPQSLTIQECVDLSLSRLRIHSNQGKIPQINTQISKNLPLVRADGDWLVEVLAKLIDNACKFTPSSGQITVKAISDGQEMLEVIISDTGRGIEPNSLEIIFDRFYQEEGALRRTTGGTGLGLAICRQIVNGWNGKIWAESPGKNQGTHLHFTIPIAQDS
jgi:DICT domain-containing protein/signal transduction histidine kinase